MKTIHSFFFNLFSFFFILGQLQKVQFTGHLAFYLHDVVIIVWLLFSLFSQQKFRVYMLKLLHHRVSRWFFLLLAWIGGGIALAFIQGQGSPLPFFYLSRLGLYLLFGCLISFLLREHLLSLKVVIKVWVITILEILLVGLLQYFFLPDTRFLLFLGWDDHYYRLIYPYLDPGFTGLLLALGFFFFYQATEKLKFTLHSIDKLLFIFLTLLFEIAILLTYSRASYFAFIAGLILFAFFYVWQKKYVHARWLAGCLVFFLVVIPFLPRPGGEGVKLERTSTIEARTSAVGAVLQQMTPADWIIGKGLFIPQLDTQAVYSSTVHATIPDNWIVFLLSGTGSVGLCLFLILCYQAGKILRSQKASPFLIVSLFMVALHGLFDASIVYPFVVLFFMVEVPVLLSKQHDHRTQKVIL